MNQDIERRLIELTPLGPAPDLRARVLAAVGIGLASSPTPTPTAPVPSGTWSCGCPAGKLADESTRQCVARSPARDGARAATRPTPGVRDCRRSYHIDRFPNWSMGVRAAGRHPKSERRSSSTIPSVSRN